MSTEIKPKYTIILQMSSAKHRPYCSGPNVLIKEKAQGQVPPVKS